MKLLRLVGILILVFPVLISGCAASHVPLSKKDLSKVVLQQSEVAPGFKGGGTAEGVMLESIKSEAPDITPTASYESSFNSPGIHSTGMYLSAVIVFDTENEATRIYSLWIQQSTQGGFSSPPTQMDTIGNESTFQVLPQQDPATGKDFNKGVGVLWRYKEAICFLYQETTPEAPIDLKSFASLAKKIQDRLAG